MGSELGLTADTQAQLDLSPVSIWWVVWGCVWTSFVAAGMAYLIVNRDMPTLRIRGLALSLSSIVLLHLFGWVCQFGLLIGAIMPGDTQYWVMGTWLPCGIALFHASNSRFLHVASLQRKFAVQGHRPLDTLPDAKLKPGLINRFRRLTYTTKIVITVGAAMVAQVFLTVLMWLISRKWHSSWGIPGTEVHGSSMAQKAAQGSGWEWWPGVFWQFVWSWIVAPIVLWKSRNIHDTQGWRVQTIGCALGNLHATPMWLIALYVPGMAPVNNYFIPPQWICLSIWIIEIFTVFLPCWEVMRHQSLRQETLDSIARWEAKVKLNSSENKSLKSDTTVVGSAVSGWKSMNASIQTTGSRDSILTMGALEHVLERNPLPLLEFSALREFSGENIAFLMAVSAWKTSLPQAPKDSAAGPDGHSRDLLRRAFNHALGIYVDFISVRHAEFPVNISSSDFKSLEDIFERAAYLLYGDEREADPVTPYDNFAMEPLSPAVSEGSEKGIANNTRNRIYYWGDIPDQFCATTFQDAEASIKYLVLTNTWPKFIKSQRYASVDSLDTLTDIGKTV